ncbi:aminotransferase class IV [Sulfuricurvum sp.]|uniref:aminotransferase class IV n=1 Tax=Sulfuricurvum sp. TaxID=2025608 RepID=UPI003BB63C71
MLLETIRCKDGIAHHLSYHQDRLERSLRSLNIPINYDLKTLIFPPITGLYRCRFLYDAQHYTIEFHPYTPKAITSLKLIHADHLKYSLKYVERSNITDLIKQREDCDDILIIQNNLLTDTSIANIALYIDGNWLTPKKPLLFGTTRARLIANGTIIPTDLSAQDLSKATKFALMNAMIGFLEVENGIIH